MDKMICNCFYCCNKLQSACCSQCMTNHRLDVYKRQQYKTLKSSVNSIRTQLNLDGKSKEQIVLKVHDYIALHTDYDTAKKPGRKSYTAYGTLINGKAVCSGYATASELLLESYGIPVVIATSDKMDHAWSLVQLNKKWYHMDITWDDPYPEKKNYVTYWFFLKTDKEFRNHPKADHYKWNSSGIKCTSTRYSRLPITDNKKMSYRGTTWYYSKKNKSSSYSYRKYNFTFTKSTILANSTVPFVKYQSRIYYADKPYRIASMTLTGQEKQKIVTVSKSKSARLTSIKIKKGRIQYKYQLKGKKKTGTKKLTVH